MRGEEERKEELRDKGREEEIKNKHRKRWGNERRK